jgi:hypothetical protein
VVCLAHPLLLSNRRHHGDHDGSSAIEPDGASAANFKREANVMKRTMEITVVNHTAVPLTKNSEKLIHGKWTDEVRPTPVIEPGGNGYINSQKETGAAYGTEGNCSYIILDQGKDSPELKITWDKPYGHGSSTVKATVSSPDSPYKASVETITDLTEHFKARVTVEAINR